MVSLCRLNETISRHQQTQRGLLGWLRVEYGIEEPSNKVLEAEQWLCGMELLDAERIFSMAAVR